MLKPFRLMGVCTIALGLFTATNVRAMDTACQDDLYVGYYLESPIANPEDPTPGSVHMLIPSTDGAFSGEMYFTYSGCQTRNVGRVSGSRAGSSLAGTWSGTVDGTSQRGTFSGTRDTNGFFSGDYDVAAGKQEITVDGCVEYFIAPFGRWFLFPVQESLPDDDLVEVDGDTIRWTPAPNALATQCQLIDLDEANCNAATSTIWQEVTLANDRSLALPKTLLVDSHKYALSCAQVDDEGNPVAFSKVTFDYPLGEPESPGDPGVPGDGDGGDTPGAAGNLAPLLFDLLDE